MTQIPALKYHNILYIGAWIFIKEPERNRCRAVSIKLYIVFVQTKAKRLIQLFPRQQARMKKFASFSVSLSPSLTLFLSLYQYWPATAESQCKEPQSILQSVPTTRRRIALFLHLKHGQGRSSYLSRLYSIINLRCNGTEYIIRYLDCMRCLHYLQGAQSRVA